MVGILVSSWDGLFSGAMFVSGRVRFRILFPPMCMFFPKQFTVGFTLKKKEVCTGLRAPAQLGVAWAWHGRGLGVRGLGVAWAWLGRGLGVGVAWAWRGRGLGVVWAWLGRGLGVAWAWRGRGLGVAWAKDLVMLL